MRKSALWPGLVVKSKLVLISAPIVSKPRYVRSKSRFSEPTRLKLLANRSTEAVAWKQSGGSNTLFSLAPSAWESPSGSEEHVVVTPLLVKEFT